MCRRPLTEILYEYPPGLVDTVINLTPLTEWGQGVFVRILRLYN